MFIRTIRRSIGPRPVLAAALVVSLAAAGAASAQSLLLAQAKKSDKLDALEQRDRELEAVREGHRKAADNETALKREIEQLGADRRRLNRELIDTAALVRRMESRIATTETRLKPLDEEHEKLRQSLRGRRAVLAEVLAALQRMGRRPPPALLVNPEDALQSVRTAILLGAVLPEMRKQAETLANDLATLTRLRQEIAAERERLIAEIATLEQERIRMAALVEARQKQQAKREKELVAEQTRATDLAGQVDNLKDLIARLEAGLDPATRAARDKARAGGPALSTLRDPGRLAPAVNFASLRGRTPVPVNGVKIKDYGAPDESGGAEKGQSIATRAGAQVTAPCDGWVVYAGSFRSYGQLLILNAGGGYHVLLAGMERVSVDLGQFVLTGEPVAVMGSGSHISAVLATGSSQPVLYVEFRKDGVPVNPSPWWAASEDEKVRG